jgi:hypothetical protein
VSSSYGALYSRVKIYDEDIRLLAAPLWTRRINHDAAAGLSLIQQIGTESFDVRNVCIHSSGVLLFAPQEYDDEHSHLEHSFLHLVSNLYSSSVGYALPVTIMRTTPYLKQFQHPSADALPILTFGHPMRHVGHHLFESILSAFATAKAAGMQELSNVLVIHSPGLFAHEPTGAASERLLLQMWRSVFTDPPMSVGAFLQQRALAPQHPVCFARALIGSIQDGRVPSQKQLPNLEHAADMVSKMRSHYGMPPLLHVTTGTRFADAEAFRQQHGTTPGMPLLLFVERSVGDPRALQNADEVVAALKQFANVARVRFQGMEQRQQMVVCEAADIFVSVYGCDAANMIFLRPGSAAVSVSCSPGSCSAPCGH